MFNSIIIIKLFYNMIFFCITTLSQDMFIVYFLSIYICIFKFYYLYVCTFMAIGNTSLMPLPINNMYVCYKLVCIIILNRIYRAFIVNIEIL